MMPGRRSINTIGSGAALLNFLAGRIVEMETGMEGSLFCF